jgi:hypothetical protein
MAIDILVKNRFLAHRGSEWAKISGRDGYNPYYPPLAKGDGGGFRDVFENIGRLTHAMSEIFK